MSASISSASGGARVSWPAAPFLGAIVAAPLLFAGGAVLHRLLLSRVSGLSTSAQLDQGASGQLIITHGLSLIPQNAGLIVFGSSPRSVLTPLAARAFMIPLVGDAALFLNKARLVAGGVAVTVTIALWLTMEHARLGKSLRAAADNPVAATYMGIDVDRAYRIAFGLGVAITAVAGGLVATYLSFTRFVGSDYVIIMYSGGVLGGMGSILGALWGGLTVGFVQQCSALVLPPQLQNAAIFVVFLLIACLRPQGFFGRSAECA